MLFSLLRVDAFCDKLVEPTWDSLVAKMDASKDSGVVILCPFVIQGANCPTTPNAYTIERTDSLYLVCDNLFTGATDPCLIDCDSTSFRVYGDLTLEMITIQRTNSTAIIVPPNGMLSVFSSTFEYNRNGVIRAMNNSKVVIESSSIRHNIASGNGGVVSTSGELVVTTTEFWNNRADLAGGNIYAGEGSLVVLQNNLFMLGNAANGGAIYNKGRLDAAKCDFFSNKATQSGGAIYNDNQGTIRLESCIFEGNTAQAGGPAVYSHWASFHISSNTGCNNSRRNTFCDGVQSQGGDCVPFSNACTYPTQAPTREPTRQPTNGPTINPTTRPTREPSLHPTVSASRIPTLIPTKQNQVRPTYIPTEISLFPTHQPTIVSSSDFPSDMPTRSPSIASTDIAWTPDPTGSPPTIQPTTVTQTTLHPSRWINTILPTLVVHSRSVSPSTMPSLPASSFPSKQPEERTDFPTDDPFNFLSMTPSLHTSSTVSSFLPSTQELRETITAAPSTMASTTGESDTPSHVPSDGNEPSISTLFGQPTVILSDSPSSAAPTGYKGSDSPSNSPSLLREVPANDSSVIRETSSPSGIKRTESPTGNSSRTRGAASSAPTRLIDYRHPSPHLRRHHTPPRERNVT